MKSNIFACTRNQSQTHSCLTIQIVKQTFKRNCNINFDSNCPCFSHFSPPFETPNKSKARESSQEFSLERGGGRVFAVSVRCDSSRSTKQIHFSSIPRACLHAGHTVALEAHILSPACRINALDNQKPCNLHCLVEVDLCFSFVH